MTNLKFAKGLFASTAISFGLMTLAPVAAQAATETVEVETVIVTANKRSENIQEVPMSVSAVSGDYLERAGITSVTDLSRFIPSVNIAQSNNNRNTTVFVRSIGSSGTNPGIESSVGIFIDGVYISAAGPIQSNLMDVAAIEVLRGPQGTLYGRNTPVGAINISSRAPTQAFEAMLTGRVGDFKDRGISGYVGGGLTDSLAARLSVYQSSRDGYETNLSGPEVNDVDQQGVRLRAQWKPTEKMTGDFVGYYSRIKSHCCTADQLAPTSPTGIATPGFLAAAAATGNPFRNFDDTDHVVDDNAPGLNLTKIYGLSANLNIDLPNDFQLTSISAFQGYKDDIQVLAADMLPQATASGAQYLRAEGYSEEVRLTSPADKRLSYIAGIYLFSESKTYSTLTVLGRDANRVLPPAPGRKFLQGDTSNFYYTQKTKSYAAFGQATFKVSEAFRLTGGLRYSHDAKDSFIFSTVNATASPAARASFSPNPLGALSRKEHKMTWSAGAQYDLKPGVMVYLLAATGHKTGGFNARGAAVGVPVEFGPEQTLTYEAGIKSVLLDRKLVLNADIYRMKLEQFQDSILNPLTGTGFIVANAGDREVQGVEAEVQFRPIDPLSFKASASYMEGEFTDYPAGQCNALKPANGTKPGTCNYNGLTPAQTPQWSGSLVANWQSPLASTGLDWFATGDLSYTGAKSLEPTLDPRGYQAAVTLVGLRAGITSPAKGWRVSAYGKNLTDESYYVQKTSQPLNAFISAGGFAAAGGFVGWYAPPRTYGLEVSMNF
jgi:iron complex outermembrane receptor protein